MFMHAVVLLHRIDLLQFRMRIKVAGKPELDVVKIAFPSAQTLGDRFGADSGITADRAVINPIAGLDHFGNLLGCSFFISDLLLYRCRHSLLSYFIYTAI